MIKTDTLQAPIELVFQEMNFIERYKKLSEDFSEKNENFKYKNNNIIETLQECGVTVTLTNNDQFFAEYEVVGDFNFRFGLTIKFNIVEFDFSVINKKLNIKSGGALGLITHLMTDWKVNIKKPGFSNEVQMKALLKECCVFYEDMKRAILTKLQEL